MTIPSDVSERTGGQQVRRIVYSQEDIARRVAEMGREITAYYPRGDDLLVLGLLKGSFIFLADLTRAIENPLTIDFLGVSSYAGTESSGVVKITHDLTKPIEGKHARSTSISSSLPAMAAARSAPETYVWCMTLRRASGTVTCCWSRISSTAAIRSTG